MAFGTPVAGTVVYSESGGTSVAPSYPASIVDTDQLVMFLGQKPSTANSGTATTPTGWTLREELKAAGGYGATLGADTGNTNLYVYTKDVVTAGLSGTVSVTLATNNVSWAFITRVPTGGGTISYGSADGQRTTAATSPLSVALTNGASATAFAAGDFAIWAMCIPTDVTTPAQFSAQAVTATGVTFNTAVELREADSTTGNDIGGYAAYAIVASGSSSTAPTVTTTVAGTLTNVRGPIALLRMRETLAERTGDMAATETGSDAFSASGDVLVEGALSVTESATPDTFAATGAVFTPPSEITGSLAATETGSDTFAGTGDVIVKGSLAVSETGSDTFASTGKVVVKGTLSATEAGSDTFAGTGDVIVKGTLVATETGVDTFSAAGDVFVKGALTATETGSDTFTATGGGVQVATGSMAATESGADTFAAVGDVIVRGALAVSEVGADTFASSGDVFVKGALTVSEAGADTLASSGDVFVKGSFAATESVLDTFAASGGAVRIGAFAATEAGQDSFAAAGGAFTAGTMAASEYGADQFASTGAIIIKGVVTATEATDQFGGYSAGYVEPGYVGGVSGKVLVQGALALTEAADSFSDYFALPAGANPGNRNEYTATRLARYGIGMRPEQIGSSRASQTGSTRPSRVARTTR